MINPHAKVSILSVSMSVSFIVCLSVCRVCDVLRDAAALCIARGHTNSLRQSHRNLMSTYSHHDERYRAM